jgi:two-component system, sensor histidine kinase PdtaS
MAVPPFAPPTVAESLTLALIASSDAPLLLLDGDLRVVAASLSFGRAFGVVPDQASGKLVFDLGSGEWDLPKLRSLLRATASGQAAIDAYELDLEVEDKDPRRLVIKAQKLQYGDSEAARLLVTVADVTEARLAERVKDDLVREKAILLQEVQHRVANSLQIIASVLLQSARNVQSEETRTHLHDAHNRVMSIATVQKQLAASRIGEVELGPYFTQLCQSLGASMIRDHNKQSIEVVADKSAVDADVSVSLGLIVTELVINALKHAFTEKAEGRITVDYHSKGPNWTLSVGDDGVGMPPEADRPAAGLGTSIVEALAHQLRAKVRVSDRQPGTLVSVVHIQIAAVDDAASTARAV